MEFSGEANNRQNRDRVRIHSASFRIKHIPILYTPYASISLKHRDRSSGFLTPTFSASGAKGFRVSELIT
jgi:lipopolysaccharide assembly outer membrane protein LptD (OstA)